MTLSGAVISGGATCGICRPAQSLTAPCGPAFADWLASGGFAQTNGSACAISATSAGAFCGKSPVRAQYNFSSGVAPSDLGNATFQTADGSCTCNYCYTFEDFDGAAGGLPLCWTSENTAAWTTNTSVGFYNTAPRSLGIDLNIAPLAVGTYSFTSQSYAFWKTTLSFWLRTNLRPNENLQLQWAVNGGSFTNVPSSAVSGCPYNNGVNSWNGTQTCTVVVSVPAACASPTATSIPIQWRWLLTVTSTRRVNPVVPPPAAVTPRGFWIDTVQSCGPSFVCP